ncbi:hypothetical protein OK006_5866 [Actinobacteria bacterium OK006]|nr:hypothetical protein OK006_5866 [Actinobacteria bacterium OK006]
MPRMWLSPSPPSLPAGHLDAELVTGVVLLGGVAGYLVRARRHRWGAELSAPLRFPLRDGAWLIAQGGGPGLNHHTPHPEQRGAIDVIGVGARGARLRSGASPDAYLIYGAKLYAPCDGDVASAADDYADQVPGTIRYEPPTATTCSSTPAVSWSNSRICGPAP